MTEKRRRRARRKFARTPLAKLAKSLYATARGRRKRRLTTQIIDELLGKDTARDIRAAGGPEKYVLQQSMRAVLDNVWKALGPLGRTIKALWEDAEKTKASGRGTLEDQLQAAIEFLNAFGYDVSQAAPPKSDKTLERTLEALDRLGQIQETVPYFETLEEVEEWPAEHVIDTRRVQRPVGGFTQPAEGLSEEIETPQSSNVFSIQYDEYFGVLYVTYKSAGKPVGYKEGANSCDGGTRYKIAVRAHRRGPTYSYGGANTPVPKIVWEGFVRAASKGQFVWNELRVCGTIHGHQYPYRLVASDGAYIPRKATAKGFRQRALATTGRGARPFAFSTLPERMFGEPDRGQPDRGAPDRGAPNRG